MTQFYGGTATRSPSTMERGLLSQPCAFILEPSSLSQKTDGHLRLSVRSDKKGEEDEGQEETNHSVNPG
jgi:hypothetical protein